MSNIILFKTSYSVEQLQQSCRSFRENEDLSMMQHDISWYVLNTLATLANKPDSGLHTSVATMLSTMKLDVDTLNGTWQIELIPPHIKIFQHLTAVENIAVNIGLQFAEDYNKIRNIKLGVRERDLSRLRSRFLIPKVVYKKQRLDIYGSLGDKAYKALPKVAHLCMCYSPYRLEVLGGPTYLRLFLRTLFDEPFADFIIATLPFK